MTLDETRLMGIEFERKVLILDPNTVLVDKLDTETIYAFLNEYLKLYVKQMYMAEDLFETGTRASTKVLDILKTLVTYETLSPTVQDTSYNLKVYQTDLPSDYYSYIRSISIISGTYKGNVEDKAIPNILIRHQDANKLLESAYDSNKIMRKAYAVLHLDSTDTHPLLYIYTDSFTQMGLVDLYYYKNPLEFSILTNTPCELPIECFDDLVNGAYQLYVANRSGRPALNVEQKQDDKK